MHRLRLACLASVALVSTGCHAPYLVRQLAGQTELLSRARTIEAVRSESDLSPEYRHSLDEIEEIVQFARRHGFNVEDAYQTYVDLEGRPLLSVLVACPPDRLEPYLWSFPVVGVFPYKGFFDHTAAKRAEAVLRAEGYETYLGRSGAFSSLGWFSDPIYSSFLDRGLADRADLLLHELTHRTVFVNDDTRLNESLATFVARNATVQFLGDRPAPGSRESLALYTTQQRDHGRLVAELAWCRGALTSAFEDPIRERRLRSRERILAELADRLEAVEFETDRYRGYRDLDWNLPLILSFDTYTGDVDALEAEWEASDRDLTTFLARLLSGEALQSLAGR